MTRLGRDCRAATMLELAVVGPVFVILLLAGFGVLRLMYIEMMMHEAILEASRYGATGADTQTGGVARLSDIVGIIQNITGINTASSTVNNNPLNTIILTITAYPDWPSLNSGTVTSPVVYGPAGDESNVVVYSVSYVDSLTNSLLGLVSAPQVTLSESTIVQNEQAFGAVKGFQ